MELSAQMPIEVKAHLRRCRAENPRNLTKSVIDEKYFILLGFA
jgi:hypothetical protein